MKFLRNFFISLLAFIYLLLEYLFWDTLLKPLYSEFKSLQFYQSFLAWIKIQNKYFILFIFILFFVISELMGVYALALLAKGLVGFFVVLYIVKFIPVAIAFAVLDNSKEQLLSINWFRYIYNLTIDFIHKIKKNKLFLKGREFFRTKIQLITNILQRKKSSKIKLFQRLFYHIIKKNKQ